MNKHIRNIDDFRRENKKGLIDHSTLFKPKNESRLYAFKHIVSGRITHVQALDGIKAWNRFAKRIGSKNIQKYVQKNWEEYAVKTLVNT